MTKYWQTKNETTIHRIISGRSNAFAVTQGENTLLVDGSVALAWPLLRLRLNALLAASAGRLSGLVLTHTHFDHAENAARIKAEFGCPVFVHRFEAEYLRCGQNLLPVGVTPLTHWMTARLAQTGSRFVHYAPVEADHVVDGHLDLDRYGFNAALLPTPGHSPGSMSVIVDHQIAICGDALFGIFPHKTFPPFANDATVLVQSWKTLLDSGCSLFLPAHGSARTRADLEREYRIYSARFPHS